jgi:hypothetical protein
MEEMPMTPNAPITPVALSWTTEGSEGRLWAECRKTFLHFTTDTDRLIKSAAIRSASANAILSKSNVVMVREKPCRQNFLSLSSVSTDMYDGASSGESGGGIESGGGSTACMTPNHACMQDEAHLRVSEANETCECNPWEDLDHVAQVPDCCSSEDIDYESIFEVTHDSVFETFPVDQDNSLPDNSAWPPWVPPGLWGDPLCKSEKATKKNRKKAAKRSSDPLTTLMIRNVPCSLTQEALLDQINSCGFEGVYDFFYLPVPRCSRNSLSNLGYAFINFTDESHARSFQMTLDGVLLNPEHSEKVCSVSLADIQGLPKLRKHFRYTSVRRGLRGPLFLKAKARCTDHDTYDTIMKRDEVHGHANNLV